MCSIDCDLDKEKRTSEVIWELPHQNNNAICIWYSFRAYVPCLNYLFPHGEFDNTRLKHQSFSDLIKGPTLK